MSRLRMGILLVILIIVLIPQLTSNGDFFDLLKAIPFGEEIFDVVSGALNYSQQVPSMRVQDIWPELLKLFFVAALSSLITDMFSFYFDDRMNIFLRVLTMAATVCLCSVFYESVHSILTDAGVIIFTLAVTAVGLLFSARKGGAFFGRNGILSAFSVKILADVFRSVAAMAAVVFIYVIINGQTGAGVGGLLISLVLLVGIQIMLSRK